jgi:hypothetical protein
MSYLRTPEQNKKHSEACKGKVGKWKRSEEQKQALRDKMRGYRLKDISGQQYNRLTVISYSHRGNYRQSYWLCQCDCGNTVVVAKNNLVTGEVKSCGCLFREAMASYNKLNIKKGPQNGNWRGGVSSEHEIIRGSNKNKEWRMSVFRRDGFVCQNCGVSGVYVEAHHIKPFSKYPEFRFSIDNGITLCVKCHKEVRNREVEILFVMDTQGLTFVEAVRKLS